MWGEGYCLQLWSSGQLLPGGAELPENKTCEDWMMAEDQNPEWPTYGKNISKESNKKQNM